MLYYVYNTKKKHANAFQILKNQIESDFPHLNFELPKTMGIVVDVTETFFSCVATIYFSLIPYFYNNYYTNVFWYELEWFGIFRRTVGEQLNLSLCRAKVKR